MKTDDFARYYQDYLSRQSSRFGISPRSALIQLGDVMQWPLTADGEDEKKAAGETRPQREDAEKLAGPRLRRAG
ncbi:hypothetical protein [Chromobacterium sphagni]|uniref:Uncharacterized protein n=1 Tax=Chromobacterium sphagni TaxID=1903179 RepID=A0A1S1X186_9NEIS|nr:hypothetical protein [Chromobacterium sphagni]OHX13303.1 hypothetical protein BI347_07120 [Chromobacterium sphagni]OHX17012.1 hypothetical protein BI344_12155 [Chromobacterium sphagni]